MFSFINRYKKNEMNFCKFTKTKTVAWSESDPIVPYGGVIPKGLEVGKLLRVEGEIPGNAERFDINLCPGARYYPPGGECDSIGLHMSFRFDEGEIVRNTLMEDGWLDEHRDGGFPLKIGETFEVIISCEPNNYRVTINDAVFCDYPYLIPFDDIKHFSISGDVILTLVSWEQTKKD